MEVDDATLDIAGVVGALQHVGVDIAHGLRRERGEAAAFLIRDPYRDDLFHADPSCAVLFRCSVL